MPIERDESLNYYTQLINKGLLYRFAFDYTDLHRDELSRFDQFTDFNEQFIVSDGLYQEMISYADENGVSRGNGNWASSDERAKVMLKAYIGRNILDNDGFFPLLNSINPVFLKAVDVLKE